MDGLTIVDHPLVQHKLTILRDRNTPVQLFRSAVRETATLLCYEVTRELPTELRAIETPIATTQSPAIAGNSGVYVVRTENVYALPNDAANIEQQRQALLQGQRMQGMGRVQEALKKSATIKDYRNKFF